MIGLYYNKRKAAKRVGGGILLIVLLVCPLSGAEKKPPIKEPDVKEAGVRTREGDILLARGEYYPALIKYLEASRLNANEVIFNKLGIVYSQLKLNRESINSFNKSISLNKKYPYSYNNLGSVYFSTRDLKHAEKNFKKAIKLNPNVASFHLNLGTVYFEKKQYNKGLEEYRKALTLDKEILSRNNALNLKAPSDVLNNPMRNYHLARIYALLGDIDGAIKYLKIASDQGCKVLDLVPQERDFDAIKEDPRFVDFMEDLKVGQFVLK